MALTALVVLLGAVVTIARRVETQTSLIASEGVSHMDAAFETEAALDGAKAKGSVPVGHADASA
eukprot:CAMPEP_0117495790 /NCGR_PEP_ID=MMETSP0784-20121206/20315_1 /TAXON_ID=39447 /ORGANISM="" /LENGTH=63 /DNA_ID=CAMNT_0005290725 /DNA_START=92 /DNA_END=279 /DNA_ORIENTATION=+